MKIIFLIISIPLSSAVLGQIDTFKTIYKDLPTLTCYRIGQKNILVNDRDTTYKVGDQIVNKETYFKSRKCQVNICRPCILILYDVNDKVSQKGVTYGDCWAGPFVDYYPNGVVKLMGQYKQNVTGIWESFNCVIKEGEWKYFNENGKLVKTEYWKTNSLVNTKLIKK